MSSERQGLVERLRQHGEAIRAGGASALWLYGSRACGDNRHDSDLDILVDYDRGRKCSVYDLVGLRHLIEDLTGLDVHIATVDSFGAANLERVRREAVQVL